MQKHFWFVLSFEHVNFVINEKYSQKNYDNPNYYVSLLIFQTYKNAILKSVYLLGWFLWLWFYPWYNKILNKHFFKWFELVKLCMVMVLGNMEDEHIFLNLAFMKIKLQNQLTTHIDLVFHMHA
jgi:hypothetical protein